MKKLKMLLGLVMIVAIVAAFTLVSAGAADIDIASTLTTSFSTAVNDSMVAMLGLVPVGLQVFALLFAVRKGMSMFRATTNG